MYKKLFLILFILTAVSGVFTKNAYADAGLPMIFLGLPFLVLAFIPVMVIEMFIYHKFLNAPLKKSGIGSFLANLLTTIVGYPISWILHIGAGTIIGYPLGHLFHQFLKADWLAYALFPLISAWLMPGVYQWQIYLAGIFGLIPAFWVSLKLENIMLKHYFKEYTPSEIKKAVWKANKTTYLLLAAFLGALCLYYLSIHLNVFDFIRNRDDEKVVFKNKVAGNLLVSSRNVFYLIDPVSKTKKKLPFNYFKEIKGKHFDDSLLRENEVWFTIENFKNVRYEKLYQFDFSTRQLKEISSWGNVSKLNPAGDGIIAFVKSVYNKNNSDQIFKVSKEGDVEELAKERLGKSTDKNCLSPQGDKLAYLRLIDTKELQDLSGKPYLVRAELKIYDFDSGQEKKLSDNLNIFNSHSLEKIDISWHPDGDKIYFTNFEITTNNPNEIDPDALSTSIYEYNLQTEEIKKLGKGVAIVGWHPDGKIFVVKERFDSNIFSLFDTEIGKSQRINFNHLRNRSDVHFTWSKDGKFIAYLGDSEHVLDQHYYQEGLYWQHRPRWIWIKEIETTLERKCGLKPINPAYEIIWR